MKRIYQPEIIKQADEVLELLKEEIEITDAAREDLCMLLTKKLIDGDLPEGVRVFSSEDELHGFISLCKAREELENLRKKGLVDTLDGESFFLTKEGTKVAENLFGKR